MVVQSKQYGNGDGRINRYPAITAAEDWRRVWQCALHEGVDGHPLKTSDGAGRKFTYGAKDA
jgi:hypothetical protein